MPNAWDVAINARTDTYWLGVGADSERLPETIRRLRTYRDAGATGVFVPGLTDLADTAHVVNGVALPLNVLYRPDVDLDQLASAGVARVRRRVNSREGWPRSRESRWSGSA